MAISQFVCLLSKLSLDARVTVLVGVGIKICLWFCVLLTLTLALESEMGTSQTQSLGTSCLIIPRGSLAASHGLCHTSYLPLHQGPVCLTHSLLSCYYLLSPLRAVSSLVLRSQKGWRGMKMSQR